MSHERPSQSVMPRWQRAYIIAMCALIGGAFAYTACDWGRWPRLFYHPLRGSLEMKTRGSAIELTYLGIFAWGIGGAAAGIVVGAVFCRLVRRAWSDRTLLLFGAWALTAVVLAGAYYTWNLYPW